MGYNQSRGAGQDDRSGSHNLILGDENNYSGFGSLVGGAANTVANGCLVFSEDSTGGDTGVVLGGVSNTAGGGFDAQGAVVVGGQRNTVTDISSVAVGGLSNSISNNDVFCAECVITGGLHLGLSSGGQFTEDGHWAAGGNPTPAFHWP